MTDQARALAAEFDEAAPGYDDGRLAPWYQAQGDMVIRTVGSLGGGCMVDIGCGTGWLLRQLLHDRPRVSGIGIDLSNGMVRSAREKAQASGIDNAIFRQGDWEQMPLEPLLAGGERARLVTCVSTLHYFRDPLLALQRVRRILAPGGRLLLLDRDKGAAPTTAALDLLHRRVARDHCRFYSASELIRFLDEAGFADVRIERRVRRLFWHGKVLSSLVLLSAINPGMGAAGNETPPELGKATGN